MHSTAVLDKNVEIELFNPKNHFGLGIKKTRGHQAANEFSNFLIYAINFLSQCIFISFLCRCFRSSKSFRDISEPQQVLQESKADDFCGSHASDKNGWGQLRRATIFAGGRIFLWKVVHTDAKFNFMIKNFILKQIECKFL